MSRPRIPTAFARDERGAVLVFWAVMLAVMLGMVALSYDFGRVSVTQSELQAYADNVALAAAGELDGAYDAITRATAAADEAISDSQTYGNGAHILSGSANYEIKFYSSLPDDDADSLTAETSDPALAAYTEVVVNSKTVPLVFARAFATLRGLDQVPMRNVVGARAVAGFTAYACDVTPLMFCMPSASWDPDLHVGDMIQLRAGGNGGAWTPGAFGFLDPSRVLVDDEGPCAGLTGSNQDRCLIGAAGPITQCFSYRGVEIEPGQKTGNLEAALNTRFDLYNSSMNGYSGNADYAPAPNVIKGIVPNGNAACIGNNEDVSPNTIGLPRDTCFEDPNTCSLVNGGVGDRFGDGTWDRDLYFETNYAPFDGTIPSAIQDWLDDNAASPSAPTRYEVYRAEIEMAGAPLTGDTDGNGHDGNPIAESGLPSCNTQTNDLVNYTRRLIVAAGVNCGAPNNISGSASNIPVETYVTMFLTEPASNDGTGNTFSIWAEIVGTAGGDGAGASSDVGIFRDLVQLYR